MCRVCLQSLYPAGLHVVFARELGGAQGGDGVRVKLGHVWDGAGIRCAVGRTVDPGDWRGQKKVVSLKVFPR